MSHSAIEEQVLTTCPFSSVISTGGSVVYSERIVRLCAASTVVYLRATFETIEYRVSGAPNASSAAARLCKISTEKGFPL